jgi:uncharacterized protein (DUF302 family)
MRIAQQEVHMHYFSKSVRMNLEDAVAATRRALERHRLKILAEIDLRHALKRHLAVDFRPYLPFRSGPWQTGEMAQP